MKNLLALLLIFALLISCKNETKELAYSSYGKEITDTDALSSERLMAHFDTMKVGDTLNTKLKGAITEVCSKKAVIFKSYTHNFVITYI